MATGIYLLDNPPRTQQFRCPRRERPSGIIGIHTAESIGDETGPDSGAENVARFIANRTTFGSYHLLADSDSIIQLVEFRCVAYHIGTHGLNEHTIGISAAAQAAKWNSYSKTWREATVRNMARAAARAARWLQRTYGITVPARRITLAQALNGQRGFLAHGDADPARRTDPGTTFPWTLFLDAYAAEMAGENPEDDMPYKDWPEEHRKALAQDVAREVHRRSVQVGLDVEPLGVAVGRTRAAARRIEAAQLDTAALATALAPLLPAGGAPTQEQLEQALKNVLGTLDNES